MEKQHPLHIKIGIRMFASILMVAIVFLSGVYVGYANRPVMQKVTGLVHKESTVSASTSADFDTFWKAWQIVEEKFPGADKITAEERMYGAIKGMLASFGDPYTTFFPPTENKEFQTQIAGEFYGIGIEIGQKDGVLTVIAPLKDTPADRAGIEAGDKIVKINDKITSDMGVDGAIDIIRGENGTPVSLTIIREGLSAPKVFTLNRAKINIPTVDTEIRPTEGVFIIHLYNFSAQSTQLFTKAFQEYLNSGYKNLVLDLRGNPGGYLEAAVQIGGLFLPEGKVIVKEIGKTTKDEKVHTSAGPGFFAKDNKLVILVDQGSASASEILAGALAEHGVGTLAGEKTYGKGSVQELIKLTSDTSVKVTVAKWYTPNGISISDHGLDPKIEIKEKNADSGKIDTQLEEAVILFKKL